MGDARHRGGHGQRQAQHSTDGQRECSPNKPWSLLGRKNGTILFLSASSLGNHNAIKRIINSDALQIKVISSRLLQIVRRSVHDHRSEILIQVTQNCEANRLGCARQQSRTCSPTTVKHQPTRDQEHVLLSSRREDRISNAPGRERAVHAGGINDPRPLAAIGQAQVWREVRVHLQHPQACVVGVNGGQRGATHQGNGHCEIGRKVANKTEGPRASAEAGQVCR